MNHFLIGLWHATKSGCYMTTSNDQLSGWTEKKVQSTSQSQTCTRKRISLFVGLLIVWSTTAFWILANPLHLRSMLSKLMRCIENCNGQPASVNRMGPILLRDNARLHVIKRMLQKLNRLELQSFASSHFHLISCQRTTTFSSIWTTFCRENAFTTAGGRKCFPRVHWIPKHEFSWYRNKQTYISFAKICWL